jgi:hypothetical protein
MERAMLTERDRVISITLSEADWRVFVSRHPQPVNWLQERIKDEIRRLMIDQSPGGRESPDA